MTQQFTIRTWPPIHLDRDKEAEVCERVAQLELSNDPLDLQAAFVLKAHFDLDDVWIEDAKAELQGKY